MVASPFRYINEVTFRPRRQDDILLTHFINKLPSENKIPSLNCPNEMQNNKIKILRLDGNSHSGAVIWTKITQMKWAWRLLLFIPCVDDRLTKCVPGFLKLVFSSLSSNWLYSFHKPNTCGCPASGGRAHRCVRARARV